MKLFRVLVVLLLPFYSTINAQEGKVKRLNIEKTQGHVNVTGTDLYLIVPEGYKQSVTCVGWNNKEGSSIVISKRSKSIKEVAEEIDNHLISLGYRIEQDQKKWLLLNGSDAIYFKTKNESVQKQFLLIKGTAFTYIIEGSCDKDISENKSIKKIILSAFIQN